MNEEHGGYAFPFLDAPEVKPRHHPVVVLALEAEPIRVLTISGLHPSVDYP